MPDLNIDTSDPTYQQLLNGIDMLRTYMVPSLQMFLFLVKNNQVNKAKLWLTKDPLLKETLKLCKDGGKYISKVMAELD